MRTNTLQLSKSVRPVEVLLIPRLDDDERLKCKSNLCVIRNATRVSRKDVSRITSCFYRVIVFLRLSTVLDTKCVIWMRATFGSYRLFVYESARNLFAALMYSVNRPMVLAIHTRERAREFLRVVVLIYRML